MESGALSDDSFPEFAKEVILFLHITTRIEGRKDDGLLGTVGGRGFPHVVAMDDAGKVVAELEGQRNDEGFRAMMKAGKEYVDLRAKAQKGDPVAKIEFFIRAMMKGDYADLDSAKKHLATLKGVTKEQQARIDVQLVNLEVQDLMKPVRENKDKTKEQELYAAAGKTFVEMRKKGRIPTADNHFGDFYSSILVHAEVEKDIPLFEEALKILEERFPRATRFFETKRKILEKLKEEKDEKK